MSRSVVTLTFLGGEIVSASLQACSLAILPNSGVCRHVAVLGMPLVRVCPSSTSVRIPLKDRGGDAGKS
jgi:hypothetical protein